mmetsp:Transcript_58858/g.140384  ORF Transcript_58858/g.140384 Transcript_58858/m.140384 type:complete len:235 (+) Transcript_58858:1342-2046(+)
MSLPDTESMMRMVWLTSKLRTKCGLDSSVGPGGVFTSSKNSSSATSPSPLTSTSRTNLQMESSSSLSEPRFQIPRISSSPSKVLEPSASSVPNSSRLTVLLSSQGSSSQGSNTPLPSLSSAEKIFSLVLSEMVRARSSSWPFPSLSSLLNLRTGSLTGFCSTTRLVGFTMCAGAETALPTSLLFDGFGMAASRFDGGDGLSPSCWEEPLDFGVEAPHPMRVRRWCWLVCYLQCP